MASLLYSWSICYIVNRAPVTVIPKIDDLSKPRYIYDVVKSNKETELQPARITSQSIIRNTVATHLFRSKIDNSDVHHTIKVHSPYEKYMVFYTPCAICRRRVMQQADCNAPAAFQNIMDNLYTYELRISIYIYIDDIFIFSNICKQHLHHVRTVLQSLRENKFYCNKEKS